MRHYGFGTGKWVFVDWLGIDPGYGTAWGGAVGDGFNLPEGVRLKVHCVSAEPEPVIRSEHPWENAMVGAYCTVLKDDGRYRCWYEPYYLKDDKLAQSGIAYAESDDGITWRKPKLGLFKFDGSTANNLVDMGTRGWAHGQSVMKDPSAPSEARYKMVSCGCDKERSIATAVSPDGLRWTWVEPILNANNSDTQNILHWNPDTKRYVLYTRQSDGVMHRRGVNRSESPTFGNFPPSVPVFESSPLDPPDWDVYCNAYSPWPGATHAHVMRPTIYGHAGDNVTVHLATSRDEIVWHRPLGREPWLIPAAAPRPRMESVYACAGIVPTGTGEWSTYAGAIRKGHNHPEKGYGRALPDEGMLRIPMREDGFMSLSAEGHGQFWTVPFRLNVESLSVNANVRYSGYLKCEVLEAGLGETGEAVTIGRPIPGYTLEDCEAVTGDAIRAALNWRGGALAALKGRSVRLRFSLFKADLYALRFGDLS